MVRSFLVIATLVAVCAGVAWKTHVPENASAHAVLHTTKVVGQPIVVAVDNVHQFGVINPGDKRTHRFTVRNDGDAPLTLKLGSTTCKCTLANLQDAVVPAGGTTEIELAWHAEEPQFRFRQAAVINTNDPRTPQFELAVEGSVRVKMGSVPATVVFSEIPRDDARHAELALYSQAYTSVEIKKLEPTLPTLQAQVSGESNDNLVIDHSQWAREMTVLKQPDGKPGSFEGAVRIHYVGRTPAGVEEHGIYELPVYGETVGDVTMHGRHVAGRLLMLGQFSRLQGKTSRVYIHFRNAPTEIKLGLHSATPDFLKLEIGQAERLSATMTRVPIDVTVPPGTAAVNYSNDHVGQVGLTTTHPDYPQVWFQVSLVVEP